MTPAGLSCPSGNFFIDPPGAVECAIVTHAHSDHARPGSRRYIALAESVPLLRARLGTDINILPLEPGEPIDLGAARVSLHPAGHIRGSAQVRVEHRGKVWIASGDSKRQPDPTCAPFEVVPCDALIIESTYALPVYRWRATHEVIQDIIAWWKAQRERGQAAILCTYVLGKAQRLLAELARAASAADASWMTESPVVLHGSVDAMTRIYREAGVPMLPTTTLAEAPSSGRASRELLAGRLVLAPPSAAGSAWIRRFPAGSSVAFASGWMTVRGVRRRRGYDLGFAISDHSDWTDLLHTVRDCGARRVLTTHGYARTLARALTELGLDAEPLDTRHADAPAADSEDG
jgi:putative mRNA 3-end processing factor